MFLIRITVVTKPEISHNSLRHSSARNGGIVTNRYRTIKNNENQALNENITERAKRSRYSIEPHRSTTTTESPRLGTCKTALLRIRWPGVGSRDPGAPLQQLFAGVILVRDHLDEAQAILLLPQRRLDRACQLLLALHLHKLPLHPLATVLQL